MTSTFLFLLFLEVYTYQVTTINLLDSTTNRVFVRLCVSSNISSTPVLILFHPRLLGSTLSSSVTLHGVSLIVPPSLYVFPRGSTSPRKEVETERSPVVRVNEIGSRPVSGVPEGRVDRGCRDQTES